MSAVVKPWYQIFAMVLNDYYFIAWYLHSALRYFNEYNGTTVGLINSDITYIDNKGCFCKQWYYHSTFCE